MTEERTASAEIAQDLHRAAAVLRGHFRYESGHHGDLWLDLDALFVEAQGVRRWAAVLADQARACRPDIVCGPLTGGAFLAQHLAVELGAGFAFAERHATATAVGYRVPDALRAALRGRRVLLADDAVNAGSALRSTLDDVTRCGAAPAGIACLLTLGPAARQIAGQAGVPCFTLTSLERGMWLADECPLCRAGTPLIDRVPA